MRIFGFRRSSKRRFWRHGASARRPVFHASTPRRTGRGFSSASPSKPRTPRRPTWRRDAFLFVVILLWLLLLPGIIATCSRSPSGVVAPEDNHQAQRTAGIADPLSIVAQGDLTIHVYNHLTGELQKMTLEEYVFGVLSAEMPALFEPEALKAQAVAARTYTVRRMLDFGGTGCVNHPGADVCTDSHHCQAYDTPQAQADKWGGKAGEYNLKLRQAVADTAGVIMLYDHQAIEALYHSTSGGRTEDAAHVFSQSLPYLTGVDSPGEQAAEHYLNTVTQSRREVCQRILAAYPNAGVTASGLTEQLEVTARYPSGRVQSMRLGTVRLTGAQARAALGLGSSWFFIGYQGDDVVFEVHGQGHGVGMSQHGANAMAKSGSDYREILLHYYQGVTLDQITSPAFAPVREP